ncbi:MAG: HAD family hydrolase [Methylotenera sp.]
MFSAAIFDMDGLLIDSECAIMDAWINAAKLAGVSLSPSDYIQIIGKAAKECDEILTSLLGGPVEFFNAMAYVHEFLKPTTPEPRFPIKPGVFELLDALRANGVPCAVASSSRRDEITHRLSDVGVLDYFAVLAGGDEVPHGKPDPAIYKLAAARLNVDPSRCIAFEDSDNGAAAALAAGLKVVVVPDIKQPSPHIIDHIFCTLDTLHEAIEHVPIWFTRV